MKKIVLEGFPVSMGKAEGKARVIENFSELENIKFGEIAVMNHFGPEYTPIVNLVAGIITETGSLMCHLAIVAREFDIPAMIRAKDATKIIRNGQKITVDCGSGKIVVDEE